MAEVPHMPGKQVGYVAGLIDGEGCISFQKNNSVKCWRGWQINPRVTISNTSSDMIDYLKGFLKTLGLRYSQWLKNPRRGKRQYAVQISRHDHIRKFLKLISPLLISKRQQAKLVTEWINIQNKRHNSMHIKDPKTGRFIGSTKADYTKRQVEIYEIVKELNRPGV